MRKILLGGAVMAALVIPLAMSPAANAYDGEQLIANGTFDEVGPGGSLLTPSSTAFALSTGEFGNYANRDTGTMYDPGRYIIASNPASLHEFWATFPEGDNKLILNGFTDQADQVVWTQTVTPQTCAAGSNITFDFSAEATNILPVEYAGGNTPGAVITVKVGDTVIGTKDLTGLSPDDAFTFSDATVPWAATLPVTILNNGTVYSGNDFAIDNISLIQRGGCQFPVPTSFNADPTAATCEAAGSFDLAALGGTFLVSQNGTDVYSFANDTVRLNVTVSGQTVDLYLYTTDNETVFTGLSAAWIVNADGRSAQRIITLDPIDTTSQVCVPDIGGKTIGFWTSKNGTTAGAPLWNDAKAGYTNAIPATTSFALAQAYLKASSSTNLGRDMLRAQFIATALNVQYINGYGDQLINVPASSAVDGGQTVSVKQYLADINAAWNGTALDTKAEITSVQNVLNAINQDVASDLFV